MGLDMYILRIRKPELEEGKIYTSDEARKFADIIIPQDQLQPELHSDLIPHTRTIVVRNPYYDLDKVGMENDLSDVRISAITGHSVIFRGTNKDGEERTVTIPADRIDREYTLVVEEQCYAASVTQEYYWRKAYDIQEFFYARYPVQNLGYYVLSSEFLQALNKTFSLHIQADDPQVDAALFYHEWY